MTIPLKERVLPLLDWLSPAARAIGAVNTIYRAADGSLAGENTDWLGIREPIARLLASRSVRHECAALVIGGGGTARAALYAMQQLGFTGPRLLLFNPRTPRKAKDLAAEFHATGGKPLCWL